LFSAQTDSVCFLCGGAKDLTGEHKIKRSLIDFHSETGSTVFNSAQRPQPFFCQSPRSKHFHFSSKLCRSCNSSLTQSADRSFDRLHKQLFKLCSENPHVDIAKYVSSRFKIEPDSYRYFAKFLCGIMADSTLPRPVPIANFALGTTSSNPIKLNIINMANSSEQRDNSFVASHGGLEVGLDKNKRFVTKFVSGLQFGPIRYEFCAELRWIEKIELELFFPRVAQLARESIKNSTQ